MHVIRRALAAAAVACAVVAPAALPASLMPVAHAAKVPAPTVVHLPTNTFSPVTPAVIVSSVADAFGVLNSYPNTLTQRYTLTKIGSTDIQLVDALDAGKMDIAQGSLAVPQFTPARGTWQLTSSSGATRSIDIIVL
jgi:hypothetical protein